MMAFHLQSSSTVPLTYLALDDVEIPAIFLRNSKSLPPDEMRGMIEEAHRLLHKRWTFVTRGEGEDSTDRNVRYVDTTHEIHEFL